MIEVRDAQPGDGKAIYDLIEDISDWMGKHREHDDREAEAGPARLEKALFEDHAAGCIVGLLDGEIVGFCLFTDSMSTRNCKQSYVIKNFYTRQDKRHQGVGTAMFEYMKELLVREDRLNMEFFIMDESYGDFAKDAIDFFATKETGLKERRIRFLVKNPAKKKG